MRYFTQAAISTAILVGSLLSVGPAAAQGADIGHGSFVGTTKASSGCPSVVLHVLRDGSALSGVAFYANGSGVSSVSGTTNGGKFEWNQVSIKGKGPVGEVTGTVSPEGTMVAKLAGSTCSFAATLPMLTNSYPGG
jgi:hypothetical protein